MLLIRFRLHLTRSFALCCFPAYGIYKFHISVTFSTNEFFEKTNSFPCPNYIVCNFSSPSLLVCSVGSVRLRFFSVSSFLLFFLLIHGCIESITTSGALYQFSFWLTASKRAQVICSVPDWLFHFFNNQPDADKADGETLDFFFAGYFASICSQHHMKKNNGGKIKFYRGQQQTVKTNKVWGMENRVGEPVYIWPTPLDMDVRQTSRFKAQKVKKLLGIIDFMTTFMANIIWCVWNTCELWLEVDPTVFVAYVEKRSFFQYSFILLPW